MLGPLGSQPSMCQGICCSGEAVTVGVTCCCVVYTLGDNNMCQCLCGCIYVTPSALFLAMLGHPEWGALGDINVPFHCAGLKLCGLKMPMLLLSRVLS